MEEFSVSNLFSYRWMRETGNLDDLPNFIAHNLNSSKFRNGDATPNFSRMAQDNSIATLIHDSTLELYSADAGLSDSPEASEIRAVLEENLAETEGRLGEQFDGFDDATGLERDDLAKEEVYGMPVSEALSRISEFYSDQLAGENVEKVELEKGLRNRNFTGRADVLRTVTDEEGEEVTELRDIKTHYSEGRILVPKDDYTISAYAFLAYGDEDIDVDRVVLEYPVQGQGYEVDPLNWIYMIADDASELEELLEASRELQADKIEEEFGRPHVQSSKEYVEGLDIYNVEKKEYARRAAEEVLAEVLKA